MIWYKIKYKYIDTIQNWACINIEINMIGIENIIKKYKFNIFKNIYFKLDIDLDLAIEFSPNYYRQRKKNKKKCNKELIFVNLNKNNILYTILSFNRFF